MTARSHFATMGTVVSLASAEPLPAVVRAEVEAVFADLDATFSLYRADSQASLVSRHELPMRLADPIYRRAYELAHDWSMATHGAFTPFRPDGHLDLSGVVKAMAIECAAPALTDAGLRDWAVNAGGDILVDGHEAAGRWVAGIVDPADRAEMISQYAFEPGSPMRAIATSGVAERGEHVWRIGGDDTFAQVSVVAGDIISADVLATAILAGGPTLLRELLATHTEPLEVLAVARDGSILATPAFRADPTSGSHPAIESNRPMAAAVLGPAPARWSA